MAFNTTETLCLNLSAGATSLKLLIGNAISDGGSTGGLISPGSPTTGSAATGSSSIKRIRGVWFSSTSATPSEIRQVTAYDTTDKRDEVTITTAANQTVQYFIIGEDSGA